MDNAQIPTYIASEAVFYQANEQGKGVAWLRAAFLVIVCRIWQVLQALVYGQIRNNKTSPNLLANQLK